MSQENNSRFRMVCPDGTTVSASVSVIRLSPFLYQHVPRPHNNQTINVLIPHWLITDLVTWMERYVADLIRGALPYNREAQISGPIHQYEYNLGTGDFYKIYAYNVCGFYLKIDRLKYTTLRRMRELSLTMGLTRTDEIFNFGGTESQRADVQRMIDYMQENP